MIKKITIKKVASFDDKGQEMNGLKKINFIYGSNGSGKTTISRVIFKDEEHPYCDLMWEDRNKLKTFVYNRDYVEKTFNSNADLKGVFTLGEDDANTFDQIKMAKEELNNIREKIQNKSRTLEGGNGSKGKKQELETLEHDFKEQCWPVKLKYNEDFKAAFVGSSHNKNNFKESVLNTISGSSADLLDLHELKKKSKVLFADKLTTQDAITPIHSSDLVSLENHSILSKKIIGKDDINIAEMIAVLGNSDWVRQGLPYFKKNNENCPFCQQKTEKAFTKNIEDYFDEAYNKDTNTIDTLITNYKEYSKSILSGLMSILGNKPSNINYDQFKAQKDKIEAIVNQNIQLIDSKKNEPSKVITLKPLKGALNTIDNMITEANVKIKSYNATIDNIEAEKRILSDNIWCFIIEEINPAYKIYLKNKGGLKKAISTIEDDIRSLQEAKNKKQLEIKRLEGNITSIIPTLNEINSLLKSFGFSGFFLAESEKKRSLQNSTPKWRGCRRNLE